MHFSLIKKIYNRHSTKESIFYTICHLLLAIFIIYLLYTISHILFVCISIYMHVYICLHLYRHNLHRHTLYDIYNISYILLCYTDIRIRNISLRITLGWMVQFSLSFVRKVCTFWRYQNYSDLKLIRLCYVCPIFLPYFFLILKLTWIID